MELLLKERGADVAKGLAIGLAAGLGTNAATKKIANGDPKKIKMISGGALLLGVLGMCTDNEYAQSAGFGMASASAANLITAFAGNELTDLAEPTATQKTLRMFTPLSGIEEGSAPTEYVPNYAQMPPLHIPAFSGEPEVRQPKLVFA